MTAAIPSLTLRVSMARGPLKLERLHSAGEPLAPDSRGGGEPVQSARILSVAGILSVDFAINRLSTTQSSSGLSMETR
jgi:hypothetical protein